MFFDSQSIVEKEFQNFYSKKTILEQCTEEKLIRLHDKFMASENKSLSYSDLRDAFHNILKIEVTDDEFLDHCKRMNYTKHDIINWSEFISYLILEFHRSDISSQQLMNLPLTGKPKIVKSRHRCPILRISFSPELKADRSMCFEHGGYVTASKDGVINYWTLDFEFQRSVQSKDPKMKITSSFVTDFIVMPDVQIVSTSSTDRDLRFYDTLANKFDLRVHIVNLDFPVVCMSYYFSKNSQEDSNVCLGLTDGSICIVSFNSQDRGPFKHDLERGVKRIDYKILLKEETSGLRVTEVKDAHKDWVNQISYYGSLQAFMSSSRCSDCSVLFSDRTGKRIRYKFSIPLGVTCFAYSEEYQMLVTGGPDSLVRIWNPYVPGKANGIFQGHHATICMIVLKHKATRLYTLSSDKCVKAWDVKTQTCIQTYNDLTLEMNDDVPPCGMYNPLTRTMIVAGGAIASVLCEEVISRDVTDGYTHAKPVSCVLYNNLHKTIVTTGMDSRIITWDPWIGRRLQLLKNAHSYTLYGLNIDVEITNACFDPSEQLLLTVARNGTLKIWDLNAGSCSKSMRIERHCELTSVAWVEDRIICAGWNRRVTEFSAYESGKRGKSWEMRHTDDVVCMAHRTPQIIATGSQNGELLLWKLETGQPYRFYRVYDPAKSCELLSEKQCVRLYNNRNVDTKRDESSGNVSQDSVRPIGIRALMFLNYRVASADTGTLLVSLDSGLVQVWTDNPTRGYLSAFSAVHALGDYVIALATDSENRFVVTGHRFGYIKVWLFENYALPNPPKISMTRLRLEFPFLWKTRLDGRAKRATKDQPLPILLTSVRGHLKPVTCLNVISQARVIVSGSVDHSVRLWTFGGRYISTLGTLEKWNPIVPSLPVFKYYQGFKDPPDVARVASATTLRVLHGGVLNEIKDKTEDVKLKAVPEDERNLLVGDQLAHPIFKRNTQSPQISVICKRPLTDKSSAFARVYTLLEIHSAKPLEKSDFPVGYKLKKD